MKPKILGMGSEIYPGGRIDRFKIDENEGGVYCSDAEWGKILDIKLLPKEIVEKLFCEAKNSE